MPDLALERIVLKPYETDWTETRSESYQTCNSSGCTPYSGYPKSVTTIGRCKNLRIYNSTNNKKDHKKWSNFQYRTFHAWGGFGRSRLAGSWWTNYATNPWSQVHYIQGTFHFGCDYTRGLSVDYPATQSVALAIAQAKLASSLKESRTQWQLAVTLGEARETAAHMASTARRLVHGFLAFKKGNIRESYRHLAGRNEAVPVRHQESFRTLKRRAKKETWLDDVSSAWMEFTYAWRPLLGDIDSAARYLAEKQVERRYCVYDISRAHKAEARSVAYTGGGINPGWTTVSLTATKARYTYEVYPDFLRKPSTMAELGFTDPATVVWELLPLSFVVDWFVNVGQVLESLFEFNQWKVKRGLVSYRDDLLQNRVLNKNYTDGTLSREIYPEQFGKWRWCTRSVLGTLPTAVPLRIKVSNPFDLKNGQMASAAVLLRYAFLQPFTSKG